MTAPNLDALAKLGPFRSMCGEVWPKGNALCLSAAELMAICNEWVELRAASPAIRAENARLRYAVHVDVTDAGYTHDNAMADAIRERDQAAKKAANEAIDHAATADLLIAAQKELTELRAYRERMERGKQSLREWIIAVNAEAGCAGADWMQADKMRMASDELGLSDPAPKEAE